MLLRSLLLVASLACSTPTGDEAPLQTPGADSESGDAEAARARAQDLLVEAREARGTGDLARARATAAEAIGMLVAIPSDRANVRSTATLAELGAFALETGDPRTARLACEHVLERRMRTLPPDHLDVQRARLELASTLAILGDLDGARALQEQVLEALTRTLPETHPELWRARRDLASTLETLGDLAGARALQQRVLQDTSRALPEDHPDVQASRLQLAATLASLGDLVAARALQEDALAAYEKLLPDEHPDLQRARLELAATLAALGGLHEARALQERVLAIYARTLPADHPDLQAARLGLGRTLTLLGDLSAARALQQEALECYLRTLPEELPELQRARLELAATLASLGELREARALLERAVAMFERTLPEDHPDLLRAWRELAWNLAVAGETDRLRAVLASLASGGRRSVATTSPSSPREMRERLSALAPTLSILLSLDPDGDGPIAREAFLLLQEIRIRSVERPSALDAAGDPEIEVLRSRARELHTRVADLVAQVEQGRTPRERLTMLLRERDQVEADLSARLVEYARASPVDTEQLAAALPEGARAVSLHEYQSFSIGSGERRAMSMRSFLAYVLARDGTLERFELGSAALIEEAVERWRAAIVAAAPSPEGSREIDAAGRALRELVLDSVLAALGDAREIFLWADGALFGVPLDALPMDSGLVGERFAIHREVSLARLLQGRADEPLGEPSLLVFGGIDYDAAPATALATIPPAAAPPVASGAVLRGERRDDKWPQLPNALLEAQAAAASFHAAFGRDAVVLRGAQASKALLLQLAPSTRVLHLATHGWFEPDSASAIDPSPAALHWHRMGPQQIVAGFAPMTLCGLALAGANLGPDPQGRVDGVVTAVELAGLDLARCELAVLAGGETAIGITRPGQGVQSSQAALRYAGARTVIASLWKVDDQRTRELFEDFYERIWIRGEPEAEALWNAKMALRAKACPVRDWAGWMLTGDPR